MILTALMNVSWALLILSFSTLFFDGGPIREGVASSYGPGFYGHRTATGEILTDSTIGVAAAPWTGIELCSWLRVYELRTGASIQIQVIDRGPFAGDHRGPWALDLTEPTVRLLGYASALDWGAPTVLYQPLPSWGSDCG